MRPVAVIMFLTLVIVACSSGPREANIVSNVAGQAFLSGMEAAAVAVQDLSTAVQSFCQSPTSDNHGEAMEAWRTAKGAWERSELTTFIGPADMMRTVPKVDYSPISEAGIDDLLASETAIDLGYVDNQAASTQRGFGAIEYALFRDLSRAADPRTCSLTTSAAEVAATETRNLADAWTVSFDGGPPWVGTFTGTMSSNQALGDVVAAIVEILKRQSLLELGKALGISAPAPEIEAIPEGAAGAAAEMYRAQLEGIRDALTAGGTESLAAMIEARSPVVAARIRLILDRAIERVAALDEPMRTLALDRPPTLEPIYHDIADLRTLFEADVVSLLDITLGFSDTDGDTG